MLNVVGKLPMMEVMDKVVTFFRTTENSRLPVLKDVIIAEVPEKVPMMEVVHRTISFLKNSEKDYVPVRKKLPPELTAPEQQICRKMEFDLNAAYFLKEQTRQPLELLEVGNAGEHSIPAGIYSMVDHKTARKIIREYQDKFVQQNKYLFIASHSPVGDQLAIIDHCADPFRIMEVIYNHQDTLRTHDMITKLKEWHARFGIRITGIGESFCEAEIMNHTIDFEILAEEVLHFCPETHQKLSMSIQQLAEKMKEENTIFLYWN